MPFSPAITALIAEAAGMKDKADAAFVKTMDNVGGGTAAPDAYMRAGEAYAGFLARNNRKADALAILDRVDAFASNRLPISVLREKVNKGEAAVPLVATPQQGAAETRCSISARR